jgi:carboxymethylenebutenolidase
MRTIHTTMIELAGATRVQGVSARLRGYLARPDDPDAAVPGVVMVHEAWGLDDVLTRQADHLAGLGYAVLAPDMYSAGGPARCLVPTFRALRTGRGRAFADLEACRLWLTEQPWCTGKVGIIGFCMGGGFALLTAPRGFDVSAPFYGMLPRDPRDLQGSCPIVASYGGRDSGLVGAAAKLERALTELGVPHDVMEYPAAGHSFMNDAANAPVPLRPLMKVANIGPEPGSAAHAWGRVEAFFAEHLA